MENISISCLTYPYMAGIKLTTLKITIIIKLCSIGNEQPFSGKILHIILNVSILNMNVCPKNIHLCLQIFNFDRLIDNAQVKIHLDELLKYFHCWNQQAFRYKIQGNSVGQLPFTGHDPSDHKILKIGH